MGIEQQTVRIDKVLKELAASAGLTTDTEAAHFIGLAKGHYHRLVNGQGATMPTLFKIARAYNVGMDYLLRDLPELVIERNGKIGWRLSHELSRMDQILQRFVAVEVLRGSSRAEIARQLANRRCNLGSAATDDDVALAKHQVGYLARGAITLGYVDLVLPEPATACRLQGLSEDLEAALTAVSPKGQRVRAIVVPNVAGQDFERDPIAPFLVARVAHEIVRKFLERYPYTSNVGLAGGMHVQAFVQTIGPRCSPLPDPSKTDRQFTVMPLTMEPFYDHLLGIADGLVSEFARRCAAMLGRRRIEAMSFKPFGFTDNRRAPKLESTAVDLVRERYHRLDVAVFGCGSGPGDGWIDEMLHRLGLDAKERVRTDVCLNLLDEEGELIPLELDGRRREPLGVDLARIQDLASREDRLALLLSTGQVKGVSMAILAKAGAINSTVCDEAAARACLHALQK